MAYDDEITAAAAGIEVTKRRDDGTTYVIVEGAWLDSYYDLRAADSKLDWRKAAFAAWYNAPKKTRQPRTMAALAELLNYKSEQVFYKWQKQPWFTELGIDGLRQSIFNRYMGDVDRATIAAALTGGHQDKRLFYEQAQRAERDEERENRLEVWLRMLNRKDDDGEMADD